MNTVEHDYKVRKELSNHLADEHRIWLTHNQFSQSTLADLQEMHDKAHDN